MEFYHPPTKQILHCAVYWLDPVLAAGPIFNLPYDGGIFFNTYHNEADLHQRPTFNINDTVFIPKLKNSKEYVSCTVLGLPPLQSDLYTIQRLDNKNILQIPCHKITAANPNATPTNIIKDINNNLPPWFKPNAPSTLYTLDLTKPRRGTLQLHQDNIWHFHTGRKNKKPPIPLPNIHMDLLHLIHTSHLTQGHPPFYRIMSIHRTQQFQNSVACHVSAASLQDLSPPTLIKMMSLSPEDKSIWSKGNDEEFNGLADLPAWTSITESEYRKIRKVVGNALPTMAISTIKYDENGIPTRAKWRIVALGNLNPHEWTTKDCFAPVLSLPELCLLTSLAIHHKRPLKSGDIKQAFVQSTLPPSEKYALNPPPGCPQTPSNTYWLLKITLYGLKCSPHHWFQKATTILKQCNLHPTPHNPCLFTGKPDGKNVMYLGLYINDFVYFSSNPTTEKAFEDQLSKIIKVDLMGQVSHFLGIKFQWTHHHDGHLDVHLNQEAFSKQLVINNDLTNSPPAHTPYWSGLTIDSIPHQPLTSFQQQKLLTQMRSMVRPLLWLSQATRPDLSTVVSLLAQHQISPSPQHIKVSKYVIHYVSGTKTLGIKFSSKENEELSTFLNFPFSPHKLLPFSDTNWGGQDQSTPDPSKP